jgi:hypothetical protein
MNRDPITKKSDQNKKRRPSLMGRCFLWFFFASLVFFGFGFLSRIPSLQVIPEGFENIVVTDVELIRTSMKEYLDQRFLFPRSNRLWFSSKKMEEHIMRDFPRIGSAEISREGQNLSLWGDEREGFYLWCGTEVQPVLLDTPCYFADDTGFIFDTAPYFSGVSYIRLYGGAVNTEIVGSQVYGEEVFAVLESFEKVLKLFDLGVQAVYIPEPDQMEFLLLSNNEMPEAPSLKHYRLNDISIVLENIHYALSREEVLFDITNSYDRLEYLDTRFNNQIVYKFFDESVPGEPQEPTEETNEETNSEPHTEALEEEALPEGTEE